MNGLLLEGLCGLGNVAGIELQPSFSQKCAFLPNDHPYKPHSALESVYDSITSLEISHDPYESSAQDLFAYVSVSAFA